MMERSLDHYKNMIKILIKMDENDNHLIENEIELPKEIIAENKLRYKKKQEK
jgi:hypothetical protein